MSTLLHCFWVTVERDGRWISICDYCGKEQDITDMTEREIYESAEQNEPCPGEVR